MAPLRRKNWFVNAKPPFAGPQAVLAYLSRYHPPCRDLQQPPDRARRDRRDVPLQGLPPQLQRAIPDHDARSGRVHPPFLLHILPKGFHRIRNYGLLASAPPRPAWHALANFLPHPSLRPNAAQPAMPMLLPRPIGDRHVRAAAAG
ncbi:hypothetical protein MES5069_900005 [Mesorhizobium escarrei]|uniref:Transposase IS801/IS1294 domain-containing protein n=1 Tax=Mesorhizobium escarrei TaxID=666018 RepID=A0ABN8KH58_9HYPH|nr:hypothetical protein MES5069_900005 [Mesorhizobium escarrei]